MLERWFTSYLFNEDNKLSKVNVFPNPYII